jgi:hypothetical protein
LKSSDSFTIQDEITDRVAATLADNFRVLVRSMVASLEDKPDDQLSGNEFVFRFFSYWGRNLRRKKMQISEQLWNEPSKEYREMQTSEVVCRLFIIMSLLSGLKELANSLDRCLMTAQRAVELNRTSQLAL